MSMTRAVVLGPLLVLVGACASDQVDTSGAGGDSTGFGGSGGTTVAVSTVSAGGSASGGAGTGGGVTTSTTAGAGGGAVCGDGVIEPPEQCEGTDFGGKSCADFGLSGGTLVCNPFCGIVVSGCTPKEACNDGTDNDSDGKTDCADEDCATALTCTDSCAGAQFVTIPSYSYGDIDGEPSVLVPSCTPTSGREQVFAVTAIVDGDLTASLYPSGFDGVIYIRTTCDDASSEIACVNAKGSGQAENATISATAGTTYFVVVESTSPTASGFYDVQIDQPTPEDFCDDMFDDDFDGYLDCDDPTSCQGSVECVPGSGALSTPCFYNTDCASANGDPICLGYQQGFNDGYCSEFCSGPGDCAGDGVCVDIGISVHGVCFDGCQTDSDCAGDFVCVSVPGGQKACQNPPEVACGDWADNDGDGLEDCEDPTSCQGTIWCTPGPNPVGATCQNHYDCQATNGDPRCISSFWDGWPGGYCSEYCDLSLNDCPSGSSCSDWLFLQSGNGLCLKDCTTTADCRSGYDCLDVGAGHDVCVF